ncbi:hypothetical protein B0H19DRAFT_1386237 [Mycena capillaripes]|nr:hypothetical protein B0H19DRAFT_1386237 [Mycena capillaripes]
MVQTTPFYLLPPAQRFTAAGVLLDAAPVPQCPSTLTFAWALCRLLLALSWSSPRDKGVVSHGLPPQSLPAHHGVRPIVPPRSSTQCRGYTLTPTTGRRDEVLRLPTTTASVGKAYCKVFMRRGTRILLIFFATILRQAVLARRVEERSGRIEFPTRPLCASLLPHYFERRIFVSQHVRGLPTSRASYSILFYGVFHNEIHESVPTVIHAAFSRIGALLTHGAVPTTRLTQYALLCVHTVLGALTPAPSLPRNKGTARTPTIFRSAAAHFPTALRPSPADADRAPLVPTPPSSPLRAPRPSRRPAPETSTSRAPPAKCGRRSPTVTPPSSPPRALRPSSAPTPASARPLDLPRTTNATWQIAPPMHLDFRPRFKRVAPTVNCSGLTSLLACSHPGTHKQSQIAGLGTDIDSLLLSAGHE